MQKSKKTFVDKIRAIPESYKLGDLYSTKANTFYILVGVTYRGGSNIKLALIRLGKNLKSQGNFAEYWQHEFDKKFKPLTEGQKLLFLQEELNDEQ